MNSISGLGYRYEGDASVILFWFSSHIKGDMRHYFKVDSMWCHQWPKCEMHGLPLTAVDCVFPCDCAAAAIPLKMQNCSPGCKKIKTVLLINAHLSLNFAGGALSHWKEGQRMNICGLWIFFSQFQNISLIAELHSSTSVHWMGLTDSGAVRDGTTTARPGRGRHRAGRLIKLESINSSLSLGKLSDFYTPVVVRQQDW